MGHFFARMFTGFPAFSLILLTRMKHAGAYDQIAPILETRTKYMKTTISALILLCLAASPALADVGISPLRHVLTTDTREATITISNPSERILDGRVSWIDLTATPTGYAPADKETRKKLSAAPYLTVTPAFFRLEPGARTEVTVSLRKGMDLPQGERRSHLLIETGTSRTPLRNASTSGLQVDVDLGISTPVILRNGQNANARLDDTKLIRDDNGALVLSTAITQLGDISTFGQLTATFKPYENDQNITALGVRDNVAGYLDAAYRTVEIPLGYETLGQGELTLRYEGVQEFSGRVFDERKFDIAPPR